MSNEWNLREVLRKMKRSRLLIKLISAARAAACSAALPFRARQAALAMAREAARPRGTALILTAMFCPLLIWLAIPPGAPFPEDYSRLVLDRDGGLLRATLATDNQYRFPPESAPLPTKYKTALLKSEDKRFYLHPGVDPMALASAALTNIKAGRRLRGGSTITMQVARLSDPKPRTYVNKAMECLQALKLSLHFSKEEILLLYSSHVPMGGNIAGIQSASHIYYGKPAEELTWAEAALLAVLPNAPSLINLERERPALVEKRNRLLKRLARDGEINSLTCKLACAEPLPGATKQLPFLAPHFTTRALASDSGSFRVRTTLDSSIQKRVAGAARYHASVLAGRGVRNLAAVAAETQTGNIRAYIGSQDFFDTRNAGQVDGVRARRSTGSLLKPFLVARALDRGPYTTKSLIRDVPTFYGTFAPQNASKEFSGLVTMDELLIKSLNVPAVRLLNAYGHRDFYDFLVNAGLSGLFRGPDGYGLTLALGGAEASLYELTQLYLCLGNLGETRALRFIEESEGDAPRADRYVTASGAESSTSGISRGLNEAESSAGGGGLFSRGAAWLVLDSLTRLSRPGVEHYWNEFASQLPVSWKTGTSYGQKDAWAIGVSRQWTIGVWAGNFNGEGNAALSGARSAAPLMFALFNSLARRDQPMRFDEPVSDLAEISCCAESGYPAGPHCENTVTLKRPRECTAPGRCPFHRAYLVDSETGRSVCSLCWDGLDTEWKTLFVVPPAAKEILVQSGRHIDSVPVHADYCSNVRDYEPMELIYPTDGIKIFIPRNFDGGYERVVLSAVHERPSTHVFWYLNDKLVRETVGRHEFALELRPGSYRLTVQDEEGFSRSAAFVAYRKEASG